MNKIYKSIMDKYDLPNYLDSKNPEIVKKVRAMIAELLITLHGQRLGKPIRIVKISKH